MHFLQKIKNYITVFILSLSIAVPSLIISPAMVSADLACQGSAECAQQGTCQAQEGQPTNCNQGSGNGSGIAKVAQTIVNVLSFIVGLVAVIMLIYGGFRYITSGGESQAVGNAKNTIIYAIVGLLLVVFAQVIVHFVINTANQATTG